MHNAVWIKIFSHNESLHMSYFNSGPYQISSVINICVKLSRCVYFSLLFHKKNYSEHLPTLNSALLSTFPALKIPEREC